MQRLVLYSDRCFQSGRDKRQLDQLRPWCAVVLRVQIDSYRIIRLLLRSGLRVFRYGRFLQGIEEGYFIEVDPKLASAQLFALVEYTLDAPASKSKANKAANLAAKLVLRGLLAKTDRIEKLEGRS